MGLDKVDLFYLGLLLFGALTLWLYIIRNGMNNKNWIIRLSLLIILIGIIILGYMWFRIFMQVIWHTQL